MSTFSESNTVEAFLRDLLCGPAAVAEIDAIKEAPATYGIATLDCGWNFIPANQLPRQPQDGFPDPLVRDALMRLNPEIAARPERAEEVLYKLRGSENFTAPLQGERTIPFGEVGEHVTVRQVDLDDLLRMEGGCQ